MVSRGSHATKEDAKTLKCARGAHSRATREKKLHDAECDPTSNRAYAVERFGHIGEGTATFYLIAKQLMRSAAVDPFSHRGSVIPLVQRMQAVIAVLSRDLQLLCDKSDSC